MKKLLLLLAALGAFSYSHAQDILTTRKGEEKLVKVIEITPEVVKYKRFDNPDGPLISVPSQEVAQIKYQNGMVQKMALLPGNATPKPDQVWKNSVAVNLLPLMAGSVNIFYDRRLATHPNMALTFGVGACPHGTGLQVNYDRELTVTGGFKSYFKDSDFYVSPYLKYRHIANTQGLYWNQAGAGSTLGARHLFKSGLVLDLFSGLGIYGLNQTNRNENRNDPFGPSIGTPSVVDLRLGFAVGFAI